ncbi:hypothetical protein FQN57_006457 [Myotisia sp. PD_48]|nr:hypothetical protein FQN57_006457 [Myotisia sp. PD_48]
MTRPGEVPYRTVIITQSVCFSVATVFVICRLGIRWTLHRRFFWDDVFSIVGHAFLLAQVVLATYLMRHYNVLEAVVRNSPAYDDSIGAILKLSLTINIMFTSSVYAIKASFLALMWRIVQNLTIFRRLWWAISIFIGLLYLVSIALEPINCAKMYKGGCLAPHDIQRNLITLRLGTAFDITTDVLVMGLPISFILRSKLPLSQKLGLVALFSLGFGIITISVVRIIALNNESHHPSITWKTYWGIIESTIAVITSCFASFKSLLTQRKRSRGSSNQYQYQYPRIPVSTRIRNGKVSSSYHDFDYPLVDRLQDETKTPNTIVVTGDNNAPVSKWDGESREEILHRTDIEISYEQNSISRQ